MACLRFDWQEHHLWILDPFHCPVNVMLDFLVCVCVSSGDRFFWWYFYPVHKSDYYYYYYYYNENLLQMLWTENTHACLKGQHNGNAYWPLERHCCCSWMWRRLSCWWWLTITHYKLQFLSNRYRFCGIDHLSLMCKTCFLERAEDCLNSFTSHSLHLVFSLDFPNAC